MPDVDGTAWRYLRGLCELPHRGSATPHEAAAARQIQAWLTELGYQAELQPFRAPRDTLYLGPACVLGGIAVALATAWRWPLAGLTLAVLLVAPLLGELLGHPHLDLDRLLPRYPSCNVVAKRPAAAGRPGSLPAARPGDAPPPRTGERPTVVIVAHYDTQRASYLFHPRVLPWTQAYFYMAYGGLGLALLVLLLRPFFFSPWLQKLLLIAAALNALNALFFLACRLSGRYVNGANDNGSGVALALALAAKLAAAPLPGVDVLLLFTGAEEVGTRGMKHFLRTTPLPRSSTYFVNLDNLGGGTLHYLLGEGMLLYQPYHPLLVKVAEQLAAEHPGQLRARRNLLLPTDGWVPALAGYPAISFLAFDQRGRLPNYHWYTDTPVRVDPQSLALAEQLVGRYVERLAARLAPGAAPAPPQGHTQAP